jgi:hypothetical protein
MVSLPRLRALHFHVRLLSDHRIPLHLEFDHTIVALKSLAYVRHLSLHTYQESTLYSMQILRRLSHNLSSLDISGRALDWLFTYDLGWSGGVLPFEDKNGTIHNRLKFPDLLFLDLSNLNDGWTARNVLREISFETSIHTLQILFHFLWSYSPQPFPHTVNRLILREPCRSLVLQLGPTQYEDPQFPEGLVANTIELVILVDDFENAGSLLVGKMLQAHFKFVMAIPVGKVKKVVWRMEFATTALRHLARETLQKAAISSLLRSVEDVCKQNGLVWEIEQP